MRALIKSVLWLPLRGSRHILRASIFVLDGLWDSLEEWTAGDIDGKKRVAIASHVTFDTAFKAGEELGDVVVLIVDDIPNARQIMELVSTGSKAMLALAGTQILHDDRKAVSMVMLEGLLHRTNERRAWTPFPTK